MVASLDATENFISADFIRIRSGRETRRERERNKRREKNKERERKKREKDKRSFHTFRLLFPLTNYALTYCLE